MPSSTRTRATSRAASTARTQILKQLKDDHRRVKKAYRDFQKLDRDEDPQACETLVRQALQDLTVHAALEEELLYPAARSAIADEDLIDEAEVEHETVHTLIEQLRNMDAEDDMYAARFTVLCEYVLHHVKEEEGEMFPQLERSRLDWEGLAMEMDQRRQELMPAAAGQSLQESAVTEGNGGGEPRKAPTSRRSAEPQRSAEPRRL